jgi:hypothetical protein
MIVGRSEWSIEEGTVNPNRTDNTQQTINAIQNVPSGKRSSIFLDDESIQ